MTSITYICAIRWHQPVWGIEHLRKCLNHAYDRQEMYGVHYNASDALKFAVMYDHLPYAKHLLERYIEEALDNNLCCPVLLLAVQHGCKEMVELLCRFANEGKIEHKGRPYIDACGCAAMENKKSPLHISCDLGQWEITKILLQYGADVRVNDKNGMSALKRCIKHALGPRVVTLGLWSNTTQRLVNRDQIRGERPTRALLPRNRSRSRSPVRNSSSVSVHSDNESNTSTIDDRTFYCIEELLKCESSLSEVMRQKLILVYQTKWGDGEDTPVDTPFSLLHHSRVTIRRALGLWLTPDTIKYLGLPTRLEEYVNLNTASFQVSEA